MGEELELMRMVTYFTKKDLEYCLQALGAPRTGKKQVLQANLLHACGVGHNQQRLEGFGDLRARQARQLVADKYHESIPNSNTILKGQGSLRRRDSGRHAVQIRCVCHNNSDFGQMVQCDAEGCGVWQHMKCVGLASASEAKDGFFCEVCRLDRADPFKKMENMVVVARLRETGARATTNGGKIEAVIGTEKTFRLSAEDHRMVKDSVGKTRRQLQVCCMLMGDTTPYRFHWPLHAELRINKIPYRVYGRGGGTKLGANGRDDTFSVGKYSKEGNNNVVLTGIDSRPYILMVAIVRKRTEAEVRELMAKPETLEEARDRICRAISGGGDDSDDEIVTLSTVISLKCPLTGMRVKRPARFVDVSGLSVFDLDAFMGMVQRNSKWQCPHTMKNSCYKFLQVDSYLERVLEVIGSADINEIEVSPEGRWRPAGTSEEFRDIMEDPSAAKPMAMLQVKAEDADARDGVSDEEDEDQELRRTAAELHSVSSASMLGSAGHVAHDDDGVIVISDSDDEDAPPPPKKARLQIVPQEPASTSDGGSAFHRVAIPSMPPGLYLPQQQQEQQSYGIPRMRIPLDRRTATEHGRPELFHPSSVGYNGDLHRQQRNISRLQQAVMGGDAAASSMPLLYKQPLGGQTLGASSQQASLAPRTSYEGRRSPIPGMGINLESFPLAGILALMPQQQDCNRVEPDLDIGSSGMTDWQGQNQVVQGMGGLPGEGTLRSQESDLLPFSMAVMQDLTPGLDFQDFFFKNDHRADYSQTSVGGVDSQTMDSSQFAMPHSHRSDYSSPEDIIEIL